MEAYWQVNTGTGGYTMMTGEKPIDQREKTFSRWQALDRTSGDPEGRADLQAWNTA
jgi:hypothetical protein